MKYIYAHMGVYMCVSVYSYRNIDQTVFVMGVEEWSILDRNLIFSLTYSWKRNVY